MDKNNQKQVPKSVFPYRCVSQRLVLEYDEVDDIMDELFADLFVGVEAQSRTKDVRRK